MLTPQEEAQPGWPPELLNNDPHGFAWGVWHDRTPKLVAQIRDTHPYGPAQRRALDGLLTEISSGVIAAARLPRSRPGDLVILGCGLFRDAVAGCAVFVV